jgi:hypothetical protein
MARRITQTYDEHMRWLEDHALVSTVMLELLRYDARGLPDLVRFDAPGHPDHGLEIEILYPADLEPIMRELHFTGATHA